MADPARLETTLVRLLRTPTGVAPGQTEITPGDPAIAAAVADVIRPLVEELGPEELVADADGNDPYTVDQIGNFATTHARAGRNAAVEDHLE